MKVRKQKLKNKHLTAITQNPCYNQYGFQPTKLIWNTKQQFSYFFREGFKN
jgi:hypothetical protein